MLKKIFMMLLAIIMTAFITLTTTGCEFDFNTAPDSSLGDESPDGKDEGTGGTHTHSWIEATCTEQNRCSECGLAYGMPLGHSGGTATCKVKAVCTVCGDSYGELAKHNFVQGACSVCGTAENEDDGGDGTTEIPDFMPISEFIKLANSLEVGERSGIKYTIRGTVLSVSNTTYGNMTVSDGTGSILIWGTWNNDGTVIYDSLSEKPETGDTVELHGVAYHFNENTIEMENAWLMSLTKPEDDNDNDNGNTGDTVPSHDYTDFTSDEKALFEEYFGFVIPFIPTDLYDIEDWSSDTEYLLCYYTLGNTEAEFNTYRNSFNSFTYVGMNSTNGISYYIYKKGNVKVELCYYLDVDNYTNVEVYVTLDISSGGSSGDSGNTGSGTPTTDSELVDAAWALPIGGSLGEQTLTGVISKLEAYSSQYNNRTLTIVVDGKTDKPIVAYRLKGDGIANLEVGDTIKITGELMNYRNSDGTGLVEFHSGCTFVLVSSGSGGDSGSGSGTVGGNNLPAGTNGVYDVDFTDATNVKDVTDQGYYIDGCPTVGSPGVLVIPVDFSDRQASSLGYKTSVIANAFGKNGVTDYYSVYDYYYISSYGQLTPNITVLDYWFRPQYASTYYERQTTEIDGYETEIGDQMIIDEALAYLEPIMDLSQFDSDGNGIIDAVVIINTLEIDADTNFHWAYRYWNYYTDDDGYYYEYDGVSANDYLWASYLFMHEDDNGNYTDTDALNTYTYIHEFGHILGVDDYYDTTDENHPMGGYDIMDGMIGDHNAYSKFNLGWVTASRLVTTDTSVTLSLKDFSKNGDAIIIANNWDTELGAYQEYYIVVYYKATGLNGTVNGVDYGYFARDGIVVYHVNAELYSEVIDGVTYYDVYNNNSTPDGEYGTEDNLIEFVQSGSGNYTYAIGDTLPSVKDDNGTRLGYTFRVDALGAEEATLTFSKIN